MNHSRVQTMKSDTMVPSTPTEIRQLTELIKGISTAMLTTVCSDGTLRSRPMATQDAESDGTLWFFTRADVPKTGEVREQGQVNVCYSDAERQRYVSISGRAVLVLNRQMIEQLWNTTYEAWFPLGLNDPQIALLRVDPEQAEYWDSWTGTVVQFAAGIPDPVDPKLVHPSNSQQIKINDAWATQDVESTRLPPQEPQP